MLTVSSLLKLFGSGETKREKRQEKIIERKERGKGGKKLSGGELGKFSGGCLHVPGNKVNKIM